VDLVKLSVSLIAFNDREASPDQKAFPEPTSLAIVPFINIVSPTLYLALILPILTDGTSSKRMLTVTDADDDNPTEFETYTVKTNTVPTPTLTSLASVISLAEFKFRLSN